MRKEEGCEEGIGAAGVNQLRNRREPSGVPTGSLAEYDPSTLKRWSVSPLQTSAPTLLIALC